MPTTACTTVQIAQLSRADAMLLGTGTGDINKTLVMTQDDARAVDGANANRGTLERNKGFIDSRTKKMKLKLYAKVQQRKLQKQIQHLDAMMQKVVDSNKELYDLYAKRKDELEAQL